MIRSAAFSPDRSKRFELVRDMSDELFGKGTVNLIGNNPSDAGENRDDPTSRKGIGFARRWGFRRVVLTNLTPEISTDPYGLSAWSGTDPENIRYLRKWMESSDLVVCAWGSMPAALARKIARSEYVYQVKELAAYLGVKLHCIGLTSNGAPLHPSRTAYTSSPEVWK